jgi:sec-independent protein translocase protein TatA
MPALGGPELLIILVLVIIVFGAGKLPQAGGALAKSIKEFRKESALDEEQPKQDQIVKEPQPERKEKTV